MNLPKRGDVWRHRNGIDYTILHVTNIGHVREDHPPDIVYQGENGNVWSRRLSDWHRSFTLVKDVP